MTHVEVNNAHIIREQEIGLRLPNGTQLYPPDHWHGHPLATADEREGILGLIRGAAVRLGFEEDHFLEHYAWVTREKIAAIVYEDGGEFPIHVTGHITGFATDYDGAHPDIPGEDEPIEPAPEPMPEETLPNSSLVD